MKQEQTSVWMPTRRASRNAAGISQGLHLEDNQPEEGADDALYSTRLSNSTRRYDIAPPKTTPPQTIIRVTKHHGAPSPQRASRTQARPLLQPKRSPVQQQAQPRQHPWLVPLGIGMISMFVIYSAGNELVSWLQAKHNDWTYGYPRTFQCDASVKHGGISHFTVENLDGHIIITEFQLNNLSKAKMYTGPILTGSGTDQQPATVTFRDVNADGYPDMIIVVSTSRYTFINDHTGFRAATPADKIDGEKG